MIYFAVVAFAPLFRYVRDIVKLDAIALILILCFAVYLAHSTRIIGFHYPEVINDQPFVDGVKITGVDGLRITLENNTVIQLENGALPKYEKIQMSVGDMVKLDTDDNQSYLVYARKNGWICGTPWNAQFTIPIIKDRVYRNRIQYIGSAVKVNE
jgi:hypothetical protein